MHLRTDTPPRSVRSLTVIAVLVFASACGSREVLVPYSAEPVEETSFAGFWELNEDSRDVARQLNRAIRDTADIRVDVFPPSENDPARRARIRTSGGLAHVFLENGRSLKVTQTPSAIFISFDRAVVAEFRFGESREISLGEVTAQRVSGWLGSEYVVETLDRNGMKVTERYGLSGGGRTLIRKIVFRGKRKNEATVVETFSRRD